jgi:iron(III) transport system substrate-binding protein
MNRKGLLLKATLGVLFLSMAATGCSGPGQGDPVTSTSASGNDSSSESPSATYDLEAARSEGLYVWWGDTIEKTTDFMTAFTKATGIPSTVERVLPGAALPQLEQQHEQGKMQVDVFLTADIGVMENLRAKGALLQYVSPEMAAYDAALKSDPEGFWSSYYINALPIMYRSDVVSPDEAPKTYEDLLDPKWKGQIGFQDASAGTSYTWWYQLRNVMPADFFDRLAEQEPRGYSSSTQILQDLNSGDLKIAGAVAIYQYTLMARDNLPINMVLPEQGVVRLNLPFGIMTGTPHENAAKAFVDYLLSAEGQAKWSEINGSYSCRSGVDAPPELPPLDSLNLLSVTDVADYASTETHRDFTEVWNHLIGVQ